MMRALSSAAAIAAAAVAAIAAVTYAENVSQQPEPGKVIWTADGERPVAQEWASSCAQGASGPGDGVAPPDTSSPRIERQDSVVAQGRYAYAITVVPGDRCHQERAELSQGNPSRPSFDDRLFQQGDDRYISFQVRLGSNFDLNVDTWRLVAQLHQQGNLGTPPLSLDVERGEWVLYKTDANVDSHDTIALWHAPATKERWVKFTLHVRFDADPERGELELWGNPAGGELKSLLPSTRTYTMKKDATGAAVPVHARIGVFRNAGHFGTETVYYDGFTVATTRAAAEKSAFQ
jgi:hypothetical protein